MIDKPYKLSQLLILLDLRVLNCNSKLNLAYKAVYFIRIKVFKVKIIVKILV